MFLLLLPVLPALTIHLLSGLVTDPWLSQTASDAMLLLSDFLDVLILENNCQYTLGAEDAFTLCVLATDFVLNVLSCGKQCKLILLLSFVACGFLKLF